MNNEKNITRREEIEKLARLIPDATFEAILQNDLLRTGVSFSSKALDYLEPFATKTYNLFTFDLQESEKVPGRASVRVPDQLHYTGGIYGLRGNVTADVHQNPDSTYHIDVIDGRLKLCEKENGNKVEIADVFDPYPVPNYRNKTFDDGVSYGQIVDAVPGKSFSRVTPFRMCQYWAKGDQCKYCDINEAGKVQKKLGLRSSQKWVEDADRVAEVMKEIYLREEWPTGKKPRSIMITGGTIITKVQGFTEDEFYLQYVEKIKDAIGSRWPVCLQSSPKPPAIAKKYKAAGVDVHETNLEVWDPELFETLCPGKAKHIGRDQWLKLMLDEVDVFGEGNITPCFVEGVEMCQPYGFKTISEAIKSSAEGYEYLMSHGVIPRPNLWVVSPRSALKGNLIPPLEFYVRLDLVWYELWQKYTLPPPRRFNLIGPGKEQSERGWLSMGY